MSGSQNATSRSQAATLSLEPQDWNTLSTGIAMTIGRAPSAGRSAGEDRLLPAAGSAQASRPQGREHDHEERRQAWR